MRVWPAGLILLALGASAGPVAADDPKTGDPKLGEKSFNDRNCNACHMRKFGGTGEEMFTRADHKVRTLPMLAAQVAACNTNLNAGWFPEDEENVVAYLNQKYYHVK
jgi:mono/diheme cytochrome c family protein